MIQQLCDRPSIFREFLGDSTAAFHQICTVTRDYDATKAHYLSKGYELAGEIVAPVQRVAYVDTMADFGFFTEVVEDTRCSCSNSRPSPARAQSGTAPIRYGC